MSAGGLSRQRVQQSIHNVESYDRAAEELAGLFGQNYRQFLHPDMPDYRDGGP